MASSELDHNHYSIEHGRQPLREDMHGHSPIESHRSPSQGSQSPEEPTLYLPATTYTNPAWLQRSKLSISTNLGSRSVNPVHGQPNGSIIDEAASPDPHEYYRQLHDPFAANTVGHERQHDGGRPSRGNGTSKRKSSLSSVWSSGGQAQSISNGDIRQPYQASPPSQYREGAPASVWSNTSLSSVGRPRQASFQDLVARFDKVDGSQPSNLKGASDKSFRNLSPTTSLNDPEGGSRRIVLSKAREVQSKLAARRPSHEPVDPLRNKAGDDASLGRVDGRVTTDIAPHREASQSLTDLGPSSSRARRRPLFGEVVPSLSARAMLSHGLSQPVRRRRGSVDFPMASPSPTFSRPTMDSESNLSAMSPDDWYRGFNPPFIIGTDASYVGGKDSQHRRAQSDVNATPWRPQFDVSQAVGLPHVTSTAEDFDGISGAAQMPNSQSRIPVRRRHSLASNSTSSAPSSRTASVLSGYPTNHENISTVKKASSRSTQKSASPRRKVGSPGRTQSPSRSLGRRDRSHTAAQQGQKSPLLRANIIAPPPKVSPPLRSSRPRLPVSAASTASSRAKTIEKLNTLQKPNHDPPSSLPKLRRPPELDNVDLEARRRKITQAFNKTIRENAQKEKFAADRRRKAREKAQAEEAARPNESTKTIRPPAVIREPSAQEDIAPDGEEISNDVFQTPGEEFAASERSLDTAVPPASQHSDDRSNMQHPDEDENDDSPTLGRPPGFASASLGRSRSSSETNDLPPLSAVTAESESTIFDTEAQIEPPESTAVHRTMLSQVMDMRGPCSAPSSAASENGSEQADKESVQIMLRNTTYYNHSEVTHHRPGTEVETGQTSQNEEKVDQSSNGSWTSSIQDRSSVEGPLRSTVEKSADQRSVQQDHHSLASSRLKKATSHETQSAGESDAYNKVSRVLDTENSKGAVNRSHFGDIYRKILEQSPDLARQGGWDTQRVTQLCLQEIDRGKYERLSKASSPLRKVKESPRKIDTSSHHEALSPEKQVPGHKYRASLNNAEDFAFTSPSIVDWMQFAAADSPTDDSRDVAPPLPPKNSDNSLAQDQALTPKAEHSETSSLGLNIHLRTPTKSPVSRTPPLRPPSHSPPPVPSGIRSIDETSTISVPSPSVFESSQSLSAFQNKPFPSLAPQVPRRITSLSRMASPSNSTDALLASSKDSVSAASGSYIGERPSSDQPAVGSSSRRSSPSPEQKRVVRRRNIIKELVDTEASFGRDMSVVDDIYKGTSSSCLDLSPEDVKILFGNSQEVVKFSMDFLDSLKQAAKRVYAMPQSQRFQSKRASRTASASTQATSASDDQAAGEGDEVTDLEKDSRTLIGEAFMNNLGEMEKVYTVYLKNHDAANRKLQALQQSPKVGIWLKECRQWAADLTKAWDLDSLLVKPVQRLLKYPLLLTSLLESTPEAHPDRDAIRDAMRGLTEISLRINDMKKHSELVEQGLKRNRKESNVRVELSKAIGRQTEKLRQNVGVSRVVEDREYAQLRDQYTENHARLVLVKEDVRAYMDMAHRSSKRFNELALAIDGWIDVGHTAFPERESKWRQFGMVVRELVSIAVPEHIAAVQKAVVDPMNTAARMLEGSMKDTKGLIQKRDKKSIDYARWKNAKERGEKVDRKMSDRMEEWEALNREAKDRMTKLMTLTGELAQGCLKGFVQIQCTWLMIWQHKLAAVIGAVASDVSKIAKEWQEDFDYHEAQALTLGVCNGSLLAEAVNLISFATPATTLDGTGSPRYPSWNGLGKRSISITSDASPSMSHEFTPRHSGSFTASPMAESYDRGQYPLPPTRMRATSAASGPSTASEGALRNGSTTAVNAPAVQSASIVRPATSAGSSGPKSPMPPRLSLDAPSPTIGAIKPRTAATRTDSGSTFYSANGGLAPGSGSFSPSPVPRAIATSSKPADIFSSALPMSESPLTATPATSATDDRRIDVLFLAASVYEFNIDRSRREAGFPYLTYVTGEIFDVIAERGELWLARNQDDSEKQIGWIWNKHFAKLAET